MKFIKKRSCEIRAIIATCELFHYKQYNIVQNSIESLITFR